MSNPAGALSHKRVKRWECQIYYSLAGRASFIIFIFGGSVGRGSALQHVLRDVSRLRTHH